MIYCLLAQPLRDKNLKLLRFVAGWASADGSLPNGETLVKEWNKKWSDEKPDWCYKLDETRIFWRDFRRAERIVTNSRGAGFIRH